MEITKLTEYASKRTQRHALVLDVTPTTVTYMIACLGDQWTEGAMAGPFKCSHDTFRAVWTANA